MNLRVISSYVQHLEKPHAIFQAYSTEKIRGYAYRLGIVLNDILDKILTIVFARHNFDVWVFVWVLYFVVRNMKYVICCHICKRY